MTRSPPQPCDHCGERRRHTAACPAPQVRSLVKRLAGAPTRVLALAVRDLSAKHQQRLRDALAGIDRGEDG